MIRKGRRAWVVAASVLVAGIGAGSACGGDDDPPKLAATTTTTTVAETTTTTVPPTTTTTALSKPSLPSDPAGMAAQLTLADTAIKDPDVTGDPLMRAGWEQQVVYRAMSRDAALAAKVLALLSPELRATAQANTKAGAELLALTKPAPALPGQRWRIVAPAPADELVGYYKAAEQASGVPWYYLASIHFVETKLGRIRGTSTAGAQGPMQFIPSTWKAYGGGGDINSNRDAIMGAARLLKANGMPERVDNAIWNYNHSDKYVAAVKLYAEQMKADERAFRGYHGWQVYYRMADGDRVLLEGYPDIPAVLG